MLVPPTRPGESTNTNRPIKHSWHNNAPATKVFGALIGDVPILGEIAAQSQVYRQCTLPFEGCSLHHMGEADANMDGLPCHVNQAFYLRPTVVAGKYRCAPRTHPALPAAAIFVDWRANNR